MRHIRLSLLARSIQDLLASILYVKTFSKEVGALFRRVRFSRRSLLAENECKATAVAPVDGSVPMALKVLEFTDRLLQC